jgi:hypothetical protein
VRHRHKLRSALTHSGEEFGQGYVRISFKLDPDPERGYDAEALWARSLGKGLYRVESSPFLLSGISFHDVVRAKERAGALEFTGVARRGGHSTYRVFLDGSVLPTDERVMRGKSRLREMGCAIESATDTWFAVDVPPGADIAAIREVMALTQATGVWGFEEGHFGHKAR